MVTRRSKGLYRIHFMIQVAIVAAAFWLYAGGVIEFYGPSVFKHYLIYCCLIIAGMVVHEIGVDHDHQVGVLHGSAHHCHRLAISKVLHSAFFIGIYLLATRDTVISRVFLFSFLPLMYGVLFVTDWWIPDFLAGWIFKGLHEQRTLLIGSAFRAGSFSTWLKRKKVLGVTCIGLLSDEKDHGDVHGIPIVGGTDDLERVIREHEATHVLLLEFPFFPGMLRHMAYICDKLGVRLLILDNLEEKFLHPITYFEDDGVRFISLRDEPLQNPVNRLVKRTIDLAVSVPVVFLVLPPICAMVWLFHRLQSPGPLFYRQRRAGLENKEFDILKFRTMRASNTETARQATKRDSRIFPTGRFLRRYSIDELPQFWNVLKGEMSVVGPRPHLIEHNQRFAKIMDAYYIRAFVKPGITGLAQIKGYRGETRFDDELIQRIQWDLYYVENWSVEMELGIIGRTIRIVLFPHETAY